MKTKLICLTLLTALLCPIVPARAVLIIGCFDTNRTGMFSADGGSAETGFRANLATNFPGAVIRSTDTITEGFLSSVDVFIGTVAVDGTTPITPLTTAEQTALVGFVSRGGGVMVFSDNDLQFQTASESFVTPFGLDSTGVISGSATATVTNVSHPVANGPFGSVSSFTIQSYPGWYDSVGPSAVGIATLDANGQVTIAAIAANRLGTGSGAVVFFSDTSINDGAFVGGLVPLVDNALAYVTPGAAGTPRLVINPDGSDVLVSWDTNVVGYRLQGSTNLATGNWTEITLTGPNQSLVSPNTPQTFYRLIRP